MTNFVRGFSRKLISIFTNFSRNFGVFLVQNFYPLLGKGDRSKHVLTSRNFDLARIQSVGKFFYGKP